MFDLEQAISEWRRRMAAGGLKADVLDELESHLRDEADAQVRAGFSVEQAFETAIQRMGQATSLSLEFERANKAKRVNSRKRLLRFFGVAAGFVIANIIFCYFIILPLASRAQGQYASWLGVQTAQANFGFVCRFVSGMCLGLAMPVGLLGLVRMGILNHQKLVRFRPYMIVVNLILGAVLTTPEVVTQVVLFVPLQMLCEASIFVARIWERRAQKCA
jgi:hypothetical protein